LNGTFVHLCVANAIKIENVGVIDDILLQFCRIEWVDL
jgi:hypothetical protein